MEVIEIYYLRSSRTLEVVLLENLNRKKLLFVYNYECYHFRVFDDMIDIISFFQGCYHPKIEFDDERQLDHYLKNIRF